MRLSLLRGIDRWVGLGLLYLLALPLRMLARIVPAAREARTRHVFLKLKGGGSLMIALPALLGLRRAQPDAEWVLVCAAEAKIYADLTGIFDRYLVIDDATPVTLATSAGRALRAGFRAALCVDLEPNSILAAVFTMLTCAGRRVGLVRPEQPIRSVAYTDAIVFNAAAPIHIYYDQIAALLGATPTAPQDCRRQISALLPPPETALLPTVPIPTLGIAAFTSGFARERMMPAAVWARLLRDAYGDQAIRLVLFGSARDADAAHKLADVLQAALPRLSIINQCGVCSLTQSAALLTQCDQLWAVDSGLLHIARLLGVSCRSFWGPTMPSQRLRPIPGLREEVRYRPFVCSPCVQAGTAPPCGGNNLCMISMAEESPDLNPPWVRKR